MPAAKYTFLTRVDEMALAEALREKFPDIRFYEYKAHPHPQYRYLDDIASADIDKVDMCVGSPRFVEVKLWEPGGHYRVFNVPDEAMFLRRSYVGEQEPTRVIWHGTLQVGITQVMTKRQISLANKVWRVLSKIGTYRLQVLLNDGEWHDDEGRRFFAGNDAIRWARQDETRRFHGTNLYYRPLPNARE
jgi:hypothetical protein